eukprot:772872-Karenia_brevis.AAC.1
MAAKGDLKSWVNIERNHGGFPTVKGSLDNKRYHVEKGLMKAFLNYKIKPRVTADPHEQVWVSKLERVANEKDMVELGDLPMYCKVMKERVYIRISDTAKKLFKTTDHVKGDIIRYGEAGEETKCLYDVIYDGAGQPKGHWKLLVPNAEIRNLREPEEPSAGDEPQIVPHEADDPE